MAGRLRNLRPIAVAGLCGVAISVAVAWALSLARPEGHWRDGPQQQTIVSGTEQPRWLIHRSHATGATALERYVAPGLVSDAIAYALPPWWSDARTPPDAADLEAQDRTRGDRMITEIAYGWPMPALRYRYTWSTHPVGFSGRLRYFESMSGGLFITPPTPGDVSSRWRQEIHALPYRPIVAGMALNAALYGTILLGAVSTARAVRSHRRRRRGLCGACGYDLRGLVPDVGGLCCPECGTNAR